MRLGIFGGTFDPPHIGHFLAATDAADLLSLDRVLFIPASVQPLKSGATVTPATDRLEMTRRLVRGEARFEADPIEVDRGGLSFTVDTLRALRERWKEDPELALFLLIGEDAARSLQKWREPGEVQRLAEVIVLARDEAGESPRGDASLPRDAGRRVPSRRVDVSSTEVRQRVKEGKSIRGFVPDAVADYIASAGLYR